MTTFLGSSFLIPSALAFIAFVAWMLVVSRMTNLGEPVYKRVLTFIWAMAVLCVAVQDVSRELCVWSGEFMGVDIPAEWRATLTVFLRSVIRAGLIVLAVVRYREIGFRHPERMAKSECEPTPVGFASTAKKITNTDVQIAAGE
jgi:hypothetical protein